MEQQPAAISTPFDTSLARDLELLSNEEFWKFACEQATRVDAAVHHEEYLECELGASGRRCWLALDALSQLVPPPHRFALLPGMPPWMVGLVAWRGDTLAVVDLTAYLADSKQLVIGQPLEGMLLITHDASGENRSFPSLGLLVPTIGLTVTISPEQVQTFDLPAPPATAVSSDWLAQMRTGVVRGSYGDAPLLDVPALLADIVDRIWIAALDE
jgi:chemotaxis signal transduction protein